MFVIENDNDDEGHDPTNDQGAFDLFFSFNDSSNLHLIDVDTM